MATPCATPKSALLDALKDSSFPRDAEKGSKIHNSLRMVLRL